MGVSNQWNGIWTGIVEWNGGMVKYRTWENFRGGKFW